MKRLNITKEKFNSSDALKKQYGTLEYVSESGKIFKTSKGRILKFVNEAREYVDDNSIDTDSVEEFIIFDDPQIFDEIAKAQKKAQKKVNTELSDTDPNEVAQAAKQASNGTAGAIIASGIASSAINATANVVASKATLGLAAAAGYKQVVDKAAEIGDEAGEKVGNTFSNIAGYNKNMNAGINANTELNKVNAQMTQQLMDYSKISNLGSSDSSNAALQMDKRAMYIANQLKSGGEVLGSRNKVMTNDQALQELQSKGYEINKDGVVNRSASWVDPAKSAAMGAAGAGWSLFGLSAATLGWIVAGVAAAALVTPYIYDKVRACTKTWMADIIAEIKFTSDGKKYRCFYDLKENKWVLAYDGVKWGSYMDNKLDDDTLNDFFTSTFFKTFLDKCRKTFALLFSTGKNEVLFKTLPEIKDAPKELKKILEKIYDNKGAITKNLFGGIHI